ncbi:MAG: family 16 glycosylhydrolase [Myxococcota bacterium]
MTSLLAVSALLTVLLSAYSLGHYLCAGLFLWRRRPRRSESGGPTDAVAVLIPAKNEAEGALRAVQSLLAQDHAGELEIYLLVKDASDSSVPFLRALYPSSNLDAPSGALVELRSTPGRRLFIAYCGADPKSEKLNWIAQRLRTKYLGILDADHQADPDWIRTSLARLAAQGAQLIQGRRAPISAQGFFPLWDSLHQHIGCELYNAAFTELGLNVFFTGTTAVMETALVQAHPFSACITEDIDFNYRILQSGSVRIISNPDSGSSEETSPDLYSFLARRRRWANGHTATFLGQLRGLLRAPLSPLGRIQALYHGSHYLVSVVVFVLHLAIGIVFLRATSDTSRVAAVAAGALLAARIARTQRTIELGARITEALVVFLWIFPAIVIAMNLTHAVMISDLSRAALPIPYALQAVGLVGLLAPLFVLLAGLGGFGQLSGGSFLVVVLTYPVAFYLDLTGVLLGMTDAWMGRARWRPVARAEADSPPPGAALQLLPTLHIKDSWRLRSFVGSSSRRFNMQLRALLKPSRLLLAASLGAIFCVGVLYEPASRIEITAGRCEALEHDGEPWIVPAQKLKGYCGNVEPGAKPESAVRTGTFKTVREDDLQAIDPLFWDRLDSTFFCNLAVFRPENAAIVPDHGLRLALEPKPALEKAYAAGSIATKTSPDAQFTYGRFEATLKPAKSSGVITAFFLYRFDPWQEIDAEFLGRDTTKLLINVYYNPGEVGDKYNYGHLGTPVLVDLGFDAALDFHKYAIEWEAGEIRWFADDRLIHVRRALRPTPIPHLPMRLYLNLWPCCSEKLVGPFEPGDKPLAAEVRAVSIARWYPSPLPHFLERFDGLFSSDEGADWRKRAKWIQ